MQMMSVGQLLRKFFHTDRFLAATRRPAEAQHAKLMEMVDRNRDTAFGRDHDFAGIRTIKDYQARVPIQDYDAHEPYIERAKRGEKRVLTADDPLMFAITSGTTGKAKYIPVTPSYLDEYIHGMQIANYFIAEDYPEVGNGKFLTPTSSEVEGHVECGIPYGAISGFMTRRQPQALRRYFALPYEMTKVKDLEAKLYLTLRLALETSVSIAMVPNPSSLIQLAEKMDDWRDDLIAEIRHGKLTDRWPLTAEVRKALEQRISVNPRRAEELRAIVRDVGRLRPAEAWPELVLLSCWKGGTMPMYLAKLPRYYGDVPVRDLGYMASEGRCATPLVDSGAAGALNITSHFFEFVPEDEMDSPNPTALTADELEPNQQYYILLSTSGGLYRYNLNDLVRVVDYFHHTPVIQFVRKGQGMSSITGEKLAESQVTAALMRALDRSEIEIAHFTTCIEWGEPPRYQCFVEQATPLSTEQKLTFLRAFEAALFEENVEYEAKRESGRLGHPVLKIVAPGTYDGYKRKRAAQGAAEAQIKIPTLSPNMEFGKEFAVVEEVAPGELTAAR